MNHVDCAGFVRDTMAGLGAEVTVSTAAPIVVSPFGANGFECPHGVAFWVEPTGEQRAAWARDGVR